ncbi:MAG: hypothetical protein J4G06_00630 [Caldilineaceae bacterium]|nr:hypothetical protein [Caldilineaceae bacterium]
MRISDFDLAVGHLWHCDRCRETFLDNPASVMIGLKLSDDQRDALNSLAAAPDTLLDRLRHVWPTDDAAFERAISHPRARLRHLGSTVRVPGGRT